MNLRHLACTALLLSGCATASGGFPSDAAVRPASDTPERFTSARAEGSSSCHSPMVDPRTSASLVLVRSADGRGDYEVPAGGYGARPGELLRIDCRTGAAMGLVRR